MIGIFDSGIGGLTIVKEFFRYLPEYPIIYFGDTARLPYGTKTPHLIKKFSKEITQWLLKKGAKIIIIACHTSSALAANSLKKEFSEVPIFEIVTPGIKKALFSTQNKKIGIIGTPATINSEIHKKELLKIDPTLKIYSKACPLFVPLVEEGWFSDFITKKIIQKYLLILKKQKIDTLILACTHYPFLKNTISQVLGEKIKIINPAEELVKEVKIFLKNNPKFPLLLKKRKVHRFYLSDQPYSLKILKKISLKRKIGFKIVNPF
jgi:glutamate racemase